MCVPEAGRQPDSRPAGEEYRMAIRKLGRITGYVGVLLVVLGLGVYLARDPLRDLLGGAVSAWVSRQLNGTLEIRALRGSLLSSLVLHQVVLRDREGTEVVRLDALRLSYDLSGLLAQRLIVHRVDLVRPQVTLVQDPEGTWNLTRVLTPRAPAEAAEAPLPVAILVEQAQIHDGHLTLQTAALPGLQSLAGLSAHLRGQIDSHGFHVQVHSLSAHALPAEVTLHTVQGSIQGDAHAVRLDALRVQTAQTLVTATGVLPGGSQPASLALHLQPLDAAELGRLLQRQDVHGLVQLTLTAAGPPDDLQVRGQLSSPGGQLDLHGHLNTVATPWRYRSHLRLTRVNLATLLHQDLLQSDLNVDLQIAGEGVTPTALRGAVHLDVQPSHLGTIALHPSRLHVTVHQGRLQVHHCDLHTSVARLTATGLLDRTGSSALHYDLTADFPGLRALLGLPTLDGHLRLQGQAQGELTAIGMQGTLTGQRLRYADYHLDSLRVTYAGSQLGDQPRVAAQLESRHVRLGSVPVERIHIDVTYDHSTAQGRFAAEVVQSSVANGQARGTFTATAAGQQLIVHDLLLRLADHAWHAAAPLTMTRDAQGLRLQSLHLAHADEAIELSGAFDGQRFHDVRLRGAQLDLTWLQRLLPLPDLAQGRATVQAHLTGTMAAPLFDVAFTLRPEPRQRSPFDHVYATLRYAEQQLHSEVRIRQAKREVVSATARLPLDLSLVALPLERRLLPTPVALHVRLQQPELAALGRWQPALPPLTGTVQGDIQVQGTYAALDLDADVRLQHGGLQGSVEHVNAPLRLQATLALIPPDTAPRVTLPQLRRAVLRVPTLRGQLPGPALPARAFQAHDLVLQAHGRWTADGFEGTLERLQTQVSLPGWPRAEVVASGRLSPQRLDLGRLHVRLPQSEIRARGALTLPLQQVQLRLDIPRLRLDEVGVTLPAPLPPLVRGTIDVQGSVLAPHIEAHLQYAGGQVLATLAAHLQEPAPRYRATLRLDDLPVSQWLADESGTLRARVQVQGTGITTAQRHAEVDLQLESSGVSLIPGLTARLRASLTGSSVRFEEVQVRSTPVVITAGGTLSTTHRSHFTYEVTCADLTPLRRLLGVPLQARGALSGTLQGTWPALQGRSRLQLRDWQYGSWRGQRLQADLTVTQMPSAPQATLKVQVVDLESAPLARSSLTLTGTATPSQGTIQVSVIAGPWHKSGLEGRFTLAHEQRLTLSHLRLQHQTLVWDNVGPITLVRHPEGSLTLQRLALRSGRQELSAQGILNAEGGLAAEVQIQRLQLSPHVRAVVSAADTVDGEVTLHLKVRGTLAQPQGEGTLHLTALRWQQQALGEVRGRLQTDGRTVSLDLRWHDRQRELLHLAGDIARDARQALALQLQATHIDLHMLQALSPAIIHSAGTLHLDLRLAGTWQQPQAYGTLRVDDGTLQLRATGMRYKDIQVHLVCTGQRLEVARFHAAAGDGRLDLNGWAESTGLTLRRLEVALQMRQFTLIYTPELEAVVSASLTLQGTLAEMLAQGTVSVPRARAQLRGKLVGGPETVQPWQLTVDGVYSASPRDGTPAATSSVGHPAALLPFLRANVQVELPQNVWVRGPGTAIELRGTLVLTKEPGEPFVLGGSVETVRGFTSFYSGKFTVEQGRVTFTGTPEINPVLDVTVTRKVAGYVVSIHVTGRATAPQLHLSSTPDLPQADIVTLLVVGKTTDRLTASERTGLSGQAQQIVGNVAASELEQLLAKPLGLDSVDIQAGEKLGDGKVSIGRYITQDLFLSYERQLGEKEGNKVGIEYSINRHLKLKGSSSDTGASALDLLWRIDY